MFSLNYVRNLLKSVVTETRKKRFHCLLNSPRGVAFAHLSVYLTTPRNVRQIRASLVNVSRLFLEHTLDAYFPVWFDIRRPFVVVYHIIDGNNSAD